MLRVSGPVSLAVLTFKNINILFFGDEHDSKKGLCKSCKQDKNCVYIPEFLQFLKNPVDIFIESFWKADKTKMTSSDVIGNVVNYFNENMYLHKQQSQGQRVHYIDIRDEDTLECFLLIMMSLLLKVTSHRDQDKIQAPFEILQYFKTTQRFNEFANILLVSNDFNKSISQKFPKTISHHFIKNTNLTNIPGTTKRTIHRIRKQILKLTPSDKKSLLEYHRHRCIEIIHETKEYDDINKMKELSNAEHVIMLDTVMSWMTHIMDMYALARMLHYMNNNKSHTIAVYAGDYHTYNYMKFFSKYLKAKIVHYQNTENTSKEKRCVTLPLEFVKKICI